jgi:hypothetical protein
MRRASATTGPPKYAIQNDRNAAFTGTGLLPRKADITLGGGGNNDYDVVGAIIGNTITMNGHFHFHYDENLLANGPTHFVASS